MRTGLVSTTRVPMNRLHEAYAALMFAAEASDGSKTFSLARFGAFEVRIIELPQCRASEGPLFWIELYRQDTQNVLVSCRCDDLDDAQLDVERLISRARELHRFQSGSSGTRSRTMPFAFDS